MKVETERVVEADVLCSTFTPDDKYIWFGTKNSIFVLDSATLKNMVFDDEVGEVPDI